MSTVPTITEDEIDDLVYLARANELSELESFTQELSEKYQCPKSDIIQSAVDAESGNTLLHYAAANNHLEILKFIHTVFTSSSSNPKEALSTLSNRINESGNTPLHWASLNGHLPCVSFLVKQMEADVTMLNKAGHDAVYEAEINGKDDVMQWLLQEGGSVLEKALGGGAEGDGEEDIIMTAGIAAESSKGKANSGQDTLAEKLEEAKLKDGED